MATAQRSQFDPTKDRLHGLGYFSDGSFQNIHGVIHLLRCDGDGWGQCEDVPHGDLEVESTIQASIHHGFSFLNGSLTRMLVQEQLHSHQ